jgi:hypothetical protein
MDDSLRAPRQFTLPASATKHSVLKVDMICTFDRTAYVCRKYSMDAVKGFLYKKLFIE